MAAAAIGLQSEQDPPTRLWLPVLTYASTSSIGSRLIRRTPPLTLLRRPVSLTLLRRTSPPLPVLRRSLQRRNRSPPRMSTLLRRALMLSSCSLTADAVRLVRRSPPSAGATDAFLVVRLFAHLKTFFESEEENDAGVSAISSTAVVTTRLALDDL